MTGVFPFLKCWPKQGSGVPSGLAGIIYQSTVYELKKKNGWFEIGESYSFRSGLIGQGMGNGIFCSEIVKGLQGACTHPPLDIFSRVFRSNLPEVSLDICCSLYL